MKLKSAVTTEVANEANVQAKSIRRKKPRNLFKWYLLIPCLIFVIYFAMVPTVFIWWVSFLRYEIIIPDFAPRFVGFRNFTNVLSSGEFWRAFEVTVWLAIVTPIIQLIIGLGLALLLSQIERGKKYITVILLIPMMIAPAAAGFNFRTLYNPTFGPLNYILQLLRLPPLAWTGSTIWALPSVMIAEIWQWTPFMMILILAGLTALPPAAYEASLLATDSRWKTFRHITLPLLRPFIFLALILRFIDAFKYMDIIWVTTGGGPGSATENLAFYTFRMGLRAFNIGYAAALSVIQLVIIIVVCNILLKPMTLKPPQVRIAGAEAENAQK